MGSVIEKIPVFGAPLRIRYKGFFDFDAIYQFMIGWYARRKFTMQETLYKDKTQTPAGNELELKTHGKRKVTEFIRYKVSIEYHLWEFKKEEVVINGEKKMMTRGRIEININGEVEPDWQGRYNGKTWINKWMGKLLWHLKENEILMEWVDPLDKDLHALNAQMKKLLTSEAE